MRFLLILILFISFSCSSLKKTKSIEIDIGYIREISKYSNFKHFISRNLECKTIESTFTMEKTIRQETNQSLNVIILKKKNLFILILPENLIYT